jgi:hypothetical protein
MRDPNEAANAPALDLIAFVSQRHRVAQQTATAMPSDWLAGYEPSEAARRRFQSQQERCGLP